MHITLIFGAFLAMLLAPCFAAWQFEFVGDNESLRQRRRNRNERALPEHERRERAASADCAADFRDAVVLHPALRHIPSARIPSTNTVPRTDQSSMVQAEAPRTGAAAGIAGQFAQRLAAQQTVIQQTQAEARRRDQTQVQARRLQEQLQAKLTVVEAIQAQLAAAAQDGAGSRGTQPAQAASPQLVETFEEATFGLLDDMPSTAPATRRRRRAG